MAKAERAALLLASSYFPTLTELHLHAPLHLRVDYLLQKFANLQRKKTHKICTL